MAFGAWYISHCTYGRVGAAVCCMPHPYRSTLAPQHRTQRTEMHILRHSSSTTTTTPPSPPPSQSQSPSPSTSPKPRFFRTFSPRPAPTSDTCDSNAREMSPRAAARALRGWFASPSSPSFGKAEERGEYKWKYLEAGKEWEGFLRSVEDEGGCWVSLPRSPASLRRVGEGNLESRRRSNSKSSDWDAAMLAHARSLGYSCPSSPSEFGSGGSVESLASGSSGWSSTHTPSMSVFSPSVRAASYYRPMRRRSLSYSNGGRETKSPTASEDFVAQYFAGAGPTEGSMLEGFRRGSNPNAVVVSKQNEAQIPEQRQQNALQLEVETHPQRATETISPDATEPTFSGATTSTASTSVAKPSSSPSRSPRDIVIVYRPPSPAPRSVRSPIPHRTFRPSLLRPRSPSSADHEDNEQCEGPPTDLDTLRVRKSKRRRNTTDGLTTIWEAGSHRDCVLNDVVVQVGSDVEGRNIDIQL